MARIEINDIVAVGSPLTPKAGASVQVNVRGGGAATVYQAATGATTRANPLTTDSVGRIEGWLEPGSYDLIVSGTGFATYTSYYEAVSGAGSDQTALNAHLVASPAHAASAISSTATGDVVATNVQSALAELASEKATAASVTAHLNDTTAAHAASAISVTPAGAMGSTNVQDAFAEAFSELGGVTSGNIVDAVDLGTVSSSPLTISMASLGASVYRQLTLGANLIINVDDTSLGQHLLLRIRQATTGGPYSVALVLRAGGVEALQFYETGITSRYAVSTTAGDRDEVSIVGTGNGGGDVRYAKGFHSA